MSRFEERAAIILTPEHVPVQLVPAGLGTRFLALVIDVLIIFVISVVVNLVLSTILPGMKMAIAMVATFVLNWGYHVYFEVRKGGQTIGKHSCGIRVVDNRGLPITFQQSFIRNIVRVLDFVPFLYGLGALVCLIDRHHRRLGDIVADTLVIQERTPIDYSRRLADPRRFNTLRTPEAIRKIRYRITLEEKEFLLSLCLRAVAMEPKSRFDIMEAAGSYYRKKLEIDDPHVSNENVVRDLTHILFTERI
jgi:uncharacterized RDD family membrane protein YckC